MQALSGYAGETAKATPPKVNPSCFGNVEDVSQHSGRVAQLVERIVDRLCGCVPETAGNAAPTTPPNGLFDEVDNQARYIRANLQRIEDALSRLEKSLP